MGLVAGGLLLGCLVPLGAVGLESLSGGTFAEIRSTLGVAKAWGLLARSVALALAIAGGAVAFGVPMGVLLARSDMLGRRWALWLHLFPLFLPPFLLALGWFHLLGQTGPFGTTWTSDLLFGPMGVVATLTLAFAPVVSALTALGLQGIDPSIEESALVASPPLRVVTHILVPLAWRSIGLGAVVVFALALSEIGVPMFLGTRTYTAAVFTRLGGVQYAPGEAVALVLPLVAIGLALVAIDRRVLGRHSFAALGLRSRESSALRLRRARVPISGIVWLGVIVSLLPLGTLVWRAGPVGLVDGLSWIRSSLATSLVSSVAAAGVIVAAGVFVGHAVVRNRRAVMGLDALALLTFMMPSSVLGVGMIAAWNRPETQIVYTTMLVLVLGLVARYAILGIRALGALFSMVSPDYEEAAAAFGSGFVRRMTHIVIPMHARGIVATWLIAVVFCLRDLDTLVIFYPPGLEPLVVRIFTLEANGPEEVVAALCVYQVLVTATLLGGCGLALRRVGRRS